METYGNPDEFGMGTLLLISVLIAVFYMIVRPQSHVLLFRRPVGTDGRTGLVDPVAAKKIKEQFRKDYDLD